MRVGMMIVIRVVRRFDGGFDSQIEVYQCIWGDLGNTTYRWEARGLLYTRL